MSDERPMADSFDLLKELFGEEQASGRTPDPGIGPRIQAQYVQNLIAKIQKRATLVKSGVFNMSDDEDRKNYEDLVNSERYTILTNTGTWTPYENRDGKDRVEKGSIYQVYLQYREVLPEKLIEILKSYLKQESSLVTIDLMKSIIVNNFEWMTEIPVVKTFLEEVEATREKKIAESKTEDSSDKKHAEKMRQAVNAPLQEDIPRLRRVYVSMRAQLALRLGVSVDKLDLENIPEGYSNYRDALTKMRTVLDKHDAKAPASPAEEESGDSAPSTLIREDLDTPAPVKKVEGEPAEPEPTAEELDRIPEPVDPNKLEFKEAVAMRPEDLVAELLAPAEVAPEADAAEAEPLKDNANTTNKTDKIPEVS